MTLALAGAALAVVQPAAATAASGSQTFAAPGEQPFIVPAGVTSVSVTLVGAPGGSGDNNSPGGQLSAVGAGGAESATIAVTPGEVLFAEIGEPGGTGTFGGPGAGGSNGGAAGGGAYAGGGGGATDVSLCSVTALDPLEPLSCGPTTSLASRLLVAGGGGGGGGSGTDGSTSIGGAGGAPGAGGDTGGSDGVGDSGGTGGLPGGQSAGGGPGLNGGPPLAGTSGHGGTGGAQQFINGFGGGGGGGGGLFGGGGGGGGVCFDSSVCASGGGGGGGSSGVPTGASGISGLSLGPASGASPSAIFTWTLPAPTAITGQMSGVSSTAATLNGIVDPNGFPITGCDFNVTPAPPSGAQVACTPLPGSGNTPISVSAALGGLTPSTTYTVSLAASSTQGSGGGQPLTFTTSAAAAAAAPTAALALTAVGESASVWRRGTKPVTSARAATSPVGTTFTYALNAAASVRFSFARVRTHGSQRTVSAGSLSFGAHAGTNRVNFDGRLAKGALKAGSFTLTISASAGASHVTAAALRFKIAKR